MQWGRRDLRKDLELTARQMEVLELLARGKTNPQIAEALGITLDGAKWHVREIIGKLGASSREEAAALWRADQRPGVRLTRVFRGLALQTSLKWLAGAAGIAVIGVGIIATFVAVQDGRGGSTPAYPPPTAGPTNSVTASATVPSGTPTASSTQATVVPSPVAGMFEAPRSLPVASRELAPPGRELAQSLPPPTFAWNGTSTMVYDRETGTVVDLGPGEPGAFSPSGEWMAWVSEDRFTGTLHALNLRTGERKDLGAGGYVAMFIDDERFLVDSNNSDGVLVNVLTGEREPVTDRSQLFAAIDQPPFTMETEGYGPGGQSVHVYDAKGQLILNFNALIARFTTESELVVVTIPQDGRANIFTIDLETGVASYIATTLAASTGFAVAGNRTHIAWSPDVCQNPGETWVLDRATDLFTHAPKALLVSPAPDGWLATGFTGLERLIDPDTMQYAFISPAGWPRWSLDYRYVSVGLVGGHGSLCI